METNHVPGVRRQSLDPLAKTQGQILHSLLEVRILEAHLKEAKLILKLNQNLLPHLSQEGQGLAFLGNITSLAVNDLGSRRINPVDTKRSHLCQIKHLPSLLKVTSLSFSLLGVGLHLVADLLPLHDLVLLGLFLGVVASVGSGHNVMLLKV